MIGTMYLTPSLSAISLFSGTLGAFLASNPAGTALPPPHIMPTVRGAITWLQENNPLIQKYGFSVNQVNTPINVLPVATIVPNEHHNIYNQVEPELPQGHPDIVVDPHDNNAEVHNEDHRYHRLPAGIVRTGEVNHRTVFTVPHGDLDLEALLFTTLYPHGKGQWRYTCPQVKPTFALDTNMCRIVC
jgi:hypothetical protein